MSGRAVRFAGTGVTPDDGTHVVFGRVEYRERLAPAQRIPEINPAATRNRSTATMRCIRPIVTFGSSRLPR